LGKRRGLLRQFLVGLPAAVMFGILIYSFDLQARFAYSEKLQAILSTPNDPWSHYLFGWFGFAAALFETLANPNSYKTSRAELARIRQGFTVILFAADVALSTFVIILVNVEKLGVSASGDLLKVALALISLTLGIVAGFITVRSDLIETWAGNIVNSSLDFRTRLMSFVLLLVLILMLVGILAAYFGYLIALLGWGFLAFLVLVVVVFVILFFVQHYVDRLKDEHLIYVSLAFFVVAVTLQFYQVLAF